MNVGLRIIHGLQGFFKNEGGGTLAELAILVPFLAVMLASVTEVGRFFQSYITVSEATRSAARYLSNHPYTIDEQNKAKNLVVCGKLTTCAPDDRLVPGLDTANVCIEATGNPTEIVTVRIPRTGDGCGAPLNYQPIFNIGALLNNSFSMEFPISPGTSMWHKSD